MSSETIKNRRAVFPTQYNSERISEEEIQSILKAANWAPTHRRTEPWRFKVFYSEGSRKGLSRFLGDTYENTTEKYSKLKLKKIIDKPLQSACVIAICMQRDPTESIPEWEEIASTAMAVQNMWLAAHEMNVGAYWSSTPLIQYLDRHIDLAEGEKCLGLFYMGKYNGKLEPGVRKSSIAEKTIWI